MARRAIASIPFFFGLKVAVGFLLLTLSARFLGLAAFTCYSQFILLFALYNMLAAGGLQNGVIRQFAAAQGSQGKQASVLSSAFAIAVTLGLLSGIVSLCFGARISQMLIGRPDGAWLVGFAALFAIACSLGQIICAALTGLGLVGRSLGAQAIAIFVSGLASALALFAGSAELAVLLFMGGMALQLPISLAVMGAHRRVLGMLHRPLRDETLLLVRFTGTFIITASSMPIVLFTLRGSYREIFGETALAHWLAANRISDVYTQLLGTYLAQIYLPSLSSRNAAHLNESTASFANSYARHLAIGIAAMASGMAIYMVNPAFWVRLGLGRSFTDATTIIGLYLVGDTLRAIPSINLSTALATHRFRLYALTELATAATFWSGASLLMAHGIVLGPAYAYIATNIVVGLSGAVLLLKR